VAGDFEGVVDLIVDEVMFCDVGGFGIVDSVVGSCFGLEGFFCVIEEVWEVFEDYLVEFEEFIDVGNVVIVLVWILG